VVAAAIEQNHDDNGIILAGRAGALPGRAGAINYQKSARVTEVADKLYEQFNAAGIDVLFDDRDARPGVKFADSELMGSHIGSSSASAVSMREISSIVTAARPNRWKYPRTNPVGYINQKLTL